MNNLIKAAQDVLNRWDSRVWNWTVHTGVYMENLRQALADHIPDTGKMVADYETIKQDRDRYRKALDELDNLLYTDRDAQVILAKALK